MGQKIGRRWRHGPRTAIFENPGGAGGGWGVSHTRTGPGRPAGHTAARLVRLGPQMHDLQTARVFFVGLVQHQRYDKRREGDTTDRRHVIRREQRN